MTFQSSKPIQQNQSLSRVDNTRLFRSCRNAFFALASGLAYLASLCFSVSDPAALHASRDAARRAARSGSRGTRATGCAAHAAVLAGAAIQETGAIYKHI